MKRSIKQNYIYNLLYQILSLLTPIITAPYLSRVLGPDGVGKYSFIESTCSYFVLFATLGLTTFGQREISYVQNDIKKRSIIFWETNIIELISSLVCITIYAFFSLLHSNWQLYIVLIFNLFAVIANISWFFQGIEEFRKITFINLIFKFFSIIFIFVFIKAKDDLIWYLLGTSLINFLNNIAYWLKIKEYVCLCKLDELNPLRHVKTVISLFVPTIAIQIYTVLDKTMIGLITNDVFENGYYEQAIAISKIVLTIVTSLGTVMIPRIGYYFENGETEIVKSYMYKNYRFVWFLGIPLCLGLICLSDSFVPWLFGPGYEKTIPLINILSLLIIAIGINSVTGVQYLIPTKRQNIFTKTVLLGAVINFLFNYLLIPSFYSFGAAISSVIAETTISISQIIIIRKELSPSVIIKSSKNYLMAGSIMFISLIIIKPYYDQSIISSLILILIGACIYFVILTIINDKFFFENIKSLQIKIKEVLDNYK